MAATLRLRLTVTLEPEPRAETRSSAAARPPPRVKIRAVAMAVPPRRCGRGGLVRVAGVEEVAETVRRCFGIGQRYRPGAAAVGLSSRGRLAEANLAGVVFRFRG